MYIRFLVIAFLGACVADDSAPQNAVDFHTATLQRPETAVAEVGNEAIRLYQELAARLDERGVTPEEMQAAVDAGDEERVRELFGFTREELADAHARLLAVVAQVEDAGEMPEGLDAPECEPTWFLRA